MATTKTWITKLCALAGIAVLSASSQAFFDEAKIFIDRALNSPTLTIRYSGASVAMVELRINGASYGTRKITSGKTEGETNFQLETAALRDGDNNVEVRLFDQDGKLVGTEKSVLTASDVNRPVFLALPKVGQTIQGAVEIKLGFGREMRNIYVSLFVNDQFRSMRNTPPFNFVWDTTRELNGWHEVEAVVVDENSNTYRTQKTKVFINNPGGRTERQGTTAAANNTAAAGTTATGNSIATGGASGPKTIKSGSGTVALNQGGPLMPKISLGTVLTNTVKPQTSNTALQKDVDPGKGIAMSQQLMTPTGSRIAAGTGSQKIPTGTNSVVAASGVLKVTYGSRLPNIGTYSISLGGSRVKFDVQPRVENGVPLTPFRHLFEHAGGSVDWENATKSLLAEGDGKTIYIRIGDKIAKINELDVEMEIAAFLEKGRTIVPLSFIENSLDVMVEFDPATGHVLIKKKQ